jgi:hypothetical protein
VVDVGDDREIAQVIAHGNRSGGSHRESELSHETGSGYDRAS